MKLRACPWIRAFLCLCGVVIASGCQRPPGQTTVVWVSIDGLRADYIERFHPPALMRLANLGALTTHEFPIFPSLTFPNHAAQVTGTTVNHHGVPMNTFYDVSSGQAYNLPDDGSALRAEPIWITAKRQGMRVAVIDWPMSHAQTGPWQSDFQLDRFDHEQTDEQRLDRVLKILKDDHGNPPVRLVMSYVSMVDTVGHRFGPDSTEIEMAVRQTDQVLGRFIDGTIAWFEKSHSPQDELYVLLTTDHGMEAIHTLVNIERVIGADLSKDCRIVTSGPVASIYMADLPESLHHERTERIFEKLRSEPFLKAWRTSQVPEDLRFSDPTRIGEIVALLSPGYTFTSQRLAATQPSRTGQLGAHGYDPSTCSNMHGAAIIWRYRHPLQHHDLGTIENTQWHATVARLLGIRPSSVADSRAIQLR